MAKRRPGQRAREPSDRRLPPRAKHYTTLSAAKQQIPAALRQWYAQAFGQEFPDRVIELLGPSAMHEAAAKDREARRLFDALKAAALAADAWCNKNPDGGGGNALWLRQLFPPWDGGRSGPWPSLRGWVDRWRLSDGPLAPETLAGLKYLVQTLDFVNLLGLPTAPSGASRFLSNTEMAKVALLCGHWPEHGVPHIRNITEGMMVALVARDVRDIRKSVGQLRTVEDLQRMGVAPRRGRRAK
jgi:hypothetical protein